MLKDFKNILRKSNSDQRMGNEEGMKPIYRSITTQDLLTDEEIHARKEVQKTIASVRTSLKITFALNTVISDLMQLTNTLVSTADAVGLMTHFDNLSVLLRMLAPIAPAFAEECWERLHAAKVNQEKRESSDSPLSSAAVSSSSSSSSIFAAPFPSDDFHDLAKGSRQICIVQENGKKRLVLQIPKVPVELLLLTEEKEDEKEGREKKLRDWMMRQIQGTDAGRNWLAKAKTEGKIWERIVVAKEGESGVEVGGG